jgi:uncharacterized protein
LKTWVLSALVLGFVLTVAGAGLFMRTPTGAESKAPVFRHDKLTVERADGRTVALDVEIAETPEQHAYGLMYRRSLPDNAGMLFLFQPPQRASFWMKNTLIPLDMLFVRKDGTVAKIAARTVPLDLKPVLSDERVAAVLEINGGAAEHLGLKTGDGVRHSFFTGK